jgi:glycosyltransferase involved in cell wall biosynthesis
MADREQKRRLTGALVAPGDADGLARAVEDMIDDWPRARASAEVAAAEARIRFSSERYRREIAAVVDKVARRT